MLDCFELLFLHKKTYVLLETGGGSWPILGLFWVFLGAYWDHLGGCLEQPWLFFHNLGVLFGPSWPMLGQYQLWQPQSAPCGKPPNWDAPWGEPEIGAHPGGGWGSRTPDPSTYMHQGSGFPVPPPMVWSVGKYTEIAGNP